MSRLPQLAAIFSDNRCEYSAVLGTDKKKTFNIALCKNYSDDEKCFFLMCTRYTNLYILI